VNVDPWPPAGAWDRRSAEPELLDLGVDETEALKSLADLRFVNRRLGGRRALRRAVLPLLHGIERPRLLDVGCGSADMPAMLLAQSPRPLDVVGVDIKPLHLRDAPPGIRPVVADAHRLPFPSRSFDVVTASLFLHHFDGHEVAGALREFARVARRALVVNDLRRARVPYYFGRLFFPLLFRSRVSVQDGLLSIRRAFTARELREAFEAAGMAHVRIERAFPYRLLATARFS
jgi:ubiquinone/menaquinone biosynthesis C-methylase UbiE